MNDYTDDSGALTRFQTFLVHGLDWDGLSAGQRNEIVLAVVESPLLGISPSRFGFVDCSASREAVIGTLYQEWQARLTVYNESKEPEVHDEVTSERQAFFLNTRDGIAGLETHRFARDTQLSASTARRRFETRLAQVLAERGFPGAWLEILRGPEVLDPSRVWSLMTSRRIVELRVTGLAGASLDESRPVFNPDVDANEFFRDRIFALTSQNVEAAEFRATDNGNLGLVKEARAYAAAGDTQTISWQEDDAPVVTEAVWNGRVDATLPEEATADNITELMFRVRSRIPSNVSLTINVIPRPGTQSEMQLDGQRPDPSST